TSESGEVQVQAVFEGKTRKIDLGRYSLLTAQRGTRAGVVAVASSLGVSRYAEMLAALRLERFDPTTGTASRTISTFGATVKPDHLPTTAAGYCCYDLVLLAGDAFAELGGRQLDAIRDWVMAGGGVCVVASTPVGAEHVKFLNALASADGAGGDDV